MRGRCAKRGTLPPRVASYDAGRRKNVGRARARAWTAGGGRCGGEALSVGKNVNVEHQICFADDIHLAVCDLLYKNTDIATNEPINDDDLDDDNKDIESRLVVEIGNTQDLTSDQNIKDVVKKVLRKALIDLNSPVQFEESDFELINEIINILGPVKLAVEALCRSDANLYTGDVTLKVKLSETSTFERNDKRVCTYEGCGYLASTRAQLVRHQYSHGETVKRHACPVCPFRTSHAGHLRRHARTHRGDKPYACPHCTFTCASLENLRKHVLRGGRHPGAFLYWCNECKVNPFYCNTAGELRKHLTSIHSDKYDMKAAKEAAKKLLLIKDQLQ
ncbi:Zinc finger protein 407 [Eumeta japonica]|uniref:Zinc finger protein 407 n=1 Tax=Eumeta variegata TaxID=151549 RepID=A0A4C1VIJ7_EUMVA|nr:Zinc finger protein 407 [Eumeta japonica]